LRGRAGAVCREPVVRLPEFEHKFNLPPSAVEHDDGLPRQQLRLAIGHEDRPVLPFEILPRRHAAMLLGLHVGFLSPPVGHLLGHRRAINRQGRRWLTPSRTDTSIGPDPVCCRRYCNSAKGWPWASKTDVPCCSREIQKAPARVRFWNRSRQK